MASLSSFHIVDYIVFMLTLIISLGIGVFYACYGDKQKTTSEYMVGSRQMKVMPVALSMLATIISAIGFIGDPAEMYAFGTQYSLVIFGAFLGTTLGALVFVPLYYPLKVISVFQYLEMRYKSRLPRTCASCLMLFNQLIVNGVGLFAPAVAIEAVTGIAPWITILVCVITATIYTSIGGIKAVVWADVFQSIVMFGGIVVVIALGSSKAGGITNIWRLNDEWGRIRFFDMDPDPTKRTTFWSVSIALSLLFFLLTGVQPMVQRFVSLPTMKDARIAVLLNVPGFMFSTTVTCISGIIVFGYYASIRCDPLRAGYIHNPNQILPYFVVDVLNYPGLPGLFIACLTSAALSSSSSSFNSSATIAWEDLLSRKFQHLSEARKTLINKCIVCVIGAGAIGVGMLIQQIKGTIIQIAFTFMGSLLGPLAGLTVLGASIPRVGPKAATLAIVISLSWNIFMGIGSIMSSVHRIPLPTPIDGCDSSANESLVYNFTSPVFSTTPLSQNLTTTSSSDIDPVKHLTGLPRLFAVSYVYYPAMGIGMMLLSGFLFSFIPYRGFKQEGLVPDEYLFVHIRFIRHWLGINPASDKSYLPSNHVESNGVSKITGNHDHVMKLLGEDKAMAVYDRESTV